MLTAMSGAELIKTPSKSKIIAFIVFNISFFRILVKASKIFYNIEYI
jgi:hypothetical protein